MGSKLVALTVIGLDESPERVGFPADSDTTRVPGEPDPRPLPPLLDQDFGQWLSRGHSPPIRIAGLLCFFTKQFLPRAEYNIGNVDIQIMLPDR